MGAINKIKKLFGTAQNINDINEKVKTNIKKPSLQIIDSKHDVEKMKSHIQKKLQNPDNVRKAAMIISNMINKK